MIPRRLGLWEHDAPELGFLRHFEILVWLHTGGGSLAEQSRDFRMCEPIGSLDPSLHSLSGRVNGNWFRFVTSQA